MYSDIFVMIKQKSDNQHIEQCSLRLKRHSVIAQMKNLAQVTNHIIQRSQN